MNPRTAANQRARSRHLLVPFDASPRTATALQYACASFPGDEIVVLFVVDRDDDVASRGWIDDPEQFDAWVEARREEADQEVFASARRIAEEHDRALSTVLAVGNRRQAIVDYWEANDFDFLVMGVRGRGFRRVLRFLRGDLGERFSRTSTMPTVLVNEGMDLPTGSASDERRLLVPFDQSHRSRQALRFACSTFPDADITVLCMYVVWGTNRTVLLDRFDTREARMNELVATAERIAAESQVDVTTIFGYGALDQAVLQFLDGTPTDLVVVGTLGRATVSEVTVPSASERLVRNAPVPLAVIPSPVGTRSMQPTNQPDRPLVER